MRFTFKVKYLVWNTEKCHSLVDHVVYRVFLLSFEHSIQGNIILIIVSAKHFAHDVFIMMCAFVCSPITESMISSHLFSSTFMQKTKQLKIEEILK